MWGTGCRQTLQICSQAAVRGARSLSSGNGIWAPGPVFVIGKPLPVQSWSDAWLGNEIRCRLHSAHTELVCKREMLLHGVPRLIPGPRAAVTIHTPSTSHSHTLFKLRRTQPTTQRREMRGGRQGGRRALTTLTGTDGHCRRGSVLPVADQRAGGHRPAALGKRALETLTLLHGTC